MIIDKGKIIQRAELLKAIPELPTIKRTHIMMHFKKHKIHIDYSSRAERSLWINNIDRLTFLRLLYEKTAEINVFKDCYIFTRHMLDRSLEIILRKTTTHTGFTQIKVNDVISHELHTQLNKYTSLLASCNNDYEVVMAHVLNLRAAAAAKKALALQNIRERKNLQDKSDVIYIDYSCCSS